MVAAGFFKSSSRFEPHPLGVASFNKFYVFLNNFLLLFLCIIVLASPIICSGFFFERNSASSECIRKSEVGAAVFAWADGLAIAVVHTKPNAPDPIRTPKLSGFRRG